MAVDPLVVSASFLSLFALLLLLKGHAHTWRRKVAILFFILFVVSAGLGAFIAGKWGDLDTGPIPAGTPVDLLANIKPSEARKLATIKELVALLRNVKKASNEEERRDANAKLATKFLSMSNSPDLVMDNGHYFGKDLTPQELEDLIDLLKTF